MRFTINVVLILLLYIGDIFAHVLKITDKRQTPSDVSLETKNGIDIYTINNNNYNEAIIFGKKLSTHTGCYMTQLLILKYNSTIYFRIATITPPNIPGINYYKKTGNKLVLSRPEEIYPELLKLKNSQNITEEAFSIFFHEISQNSNDLNKSEGDDSNQNTNGDLRGTKVVNNANPQPMHNTLNPSTVSRTCGNTQKVHQFTGQFQEYDGIEIDSIIQKVVLDSDVSINGVTKDDTNNDYTLYMVEGGYNPKHHINQISFGPLLLDYNDDHFISLMSMKGGDRHIEIVSKHNQGFYTMIYNGDKYKLDRTIPRYSKLPMPIEGKYMLLDIINPNFSDISTHVKLSIHSGYLLYEIFDSDATVDVRCMNIDVYLSNVEKQRQIHVQSNNKDVTSVTITSVVDGNVLVRYFEKNGYIFVFSNDH